MAINRAPQPIKGRPWLLLAILAVTLLLMARLRQCTPLPANASSPDLSDSSEPSDSSNTVKYIRWEEP